MTKVARQVKTQDIQLIQPWLNEATERLRAEFDPEKIILFGSWPVVRRLSVGYRFVYDLAV